MSQEKKPISNGHCPVCDSSMIEGEAFDTDDNCVAQECWCLHCEASWRDVYQIVEQIVHLEP